MVRTADPTGWPRARRDRCADQSPLPGALIKTVDGCRKAADRGGDEPGRGETPAREDPGGGFDLTGLEDGAGHGTSGEASGF